MRSSILVLLPIVGLTACKVDNVLSGKGQDPEPFDTGSTYDPVDTSDSDVPVDDSGGTVVTTGDCESNSYAGHTITQIDECDAPSAHPAWELVEKFSDMTIGMTLSSPAFGKLADTNGNGHIDDGDQTYVVVAPYQGGVTAYNGTDGSILWHTTGTDIEQNAPAIGDLDGDGWPEVVVGGLYGSKAYRGDDGAVFWSGPGTDNTKAYCGAVSIADLDGDGDPEVLLGRQILSGQTGAELAEGAYGQGSSVNGEAPDSVAADIDLDGEQEVLVGNAAYDIDGNAVAHASGSDGYPAVGNFDSDPEAEIVVAASGSIMLLDTDYTTIWSVSTGGGYQGPPAIADFDGDGDPEIAVPNNTGVSVYEGDGTRVWTYTNTAGSMFDGVSAYDLDGDGDWEVLDNGASSLRILDGATGAVLASYAHATSQYSCGQEPVVADIDDDGAVEIGYGVYSTPGGFGILEDADDAFAPGLGYWNQDPFSITNINDDMTVPTYPDINWESYNSFRAGPPIDLLFPSKNLTVQLDDVCTDECAAGKITIWWSLGNDGGEDIPDDIDVAFWGVTSSGDVLLGSTTYAGNKPAGWLNDSVETELTGVPTPLYDVYVTIDGGNNSEASLIGECDETDNEARLGSALCE